MDQYIRRRKRKLNYKRVLMVVIVFIIILLFAIFSIVIKTNKKAEQMRIEAEQKAQEEEQMRIALEAQKREEELRKQKEEEENATGVIYLTFDDGPTYDSTPQILDILKRRNIKATFFVLHYDENHEQYIKREQEEGHTIALHGYSHTYSEIYQSADTCLENFRKIKEQVYQTTGVESKIIRFPGGSSNVVSKKYCEGVMTELVTRVVDEGYRYFDWNVDSGDAAKPKSEEVVYNNVVNGIKPGRNNVVLMHDFAGNHKTIDELDRIITWGLEQGYVFRRITEETPMVKHGVNN